LKDKSMRLSPARIAAALAVSALGLTGCGTVKDAVNGPKLTAMDRPALAAAQTPTPAVIASSLTPSPPVPVPTATPNSLWRPGARAFFIDQRASRVGDILSVLINISDSAKLSNTTTSSRTNATTGGIPHFFGLEALAGKILPAGYDPTKMIDQSGNTTSAGAGNVNRQEQISLTVAAVVTGVLPNGNLVIQGSQEVKTNNELRELTVSGIVRPEDISSANTIPHSQIAEARISYGGRGDLSRVNKTPAGQAIAESFSPF
jgi:flagellar L-ring protein precursor FlgH